MIWLVWKQNITKAVFHHTLASQISSIALLNCACMQHACMKMFLHACTHACTLNCMHADTYCMHAEAYCMHAGGYCMHADTHCLLHTEINY